MEHYYSVNPESEHDFRQVCFALGERTFSMTTDAGVFSRSALDEGTALMHRCLPPLSGDVLELGCGWGALSLPLAAISPPKSLLLTDVNLRALELTRINAEALGLSVTVRESDGFAGVEGAFDMILTNPPIRAGKAVYYPWFAQSREHMKPGGLFACVVQKKQGAPSVRKALEEVYGACELLGRSRGYQVLAARRSE